ncbi:glycosyltransferase [Pseudarthrobacter oxydans]|uniref:glycosyltransferase n=1 Tax=Pseudarthrobacter oxydans TaxID=1671 RepID=UPI003828ED01
MAAKELLAGHEKPTLVFTAVDDYFGKLPWLSLVVRWLFPRTRIIVIRYRVADLIPSKSISLRQMQKKILLRILDKLVHPETAMFDERVPLQPNLHVLPDPWSGPFGNSSRKDARRHLDWADEVETILLVGGQDERKGFDVAVTALKRLHTERAVRVVLVGRVSRHLQAQLEQLVQTFGDSFTHVSEYISDEDLAIYFAASSVVLLPYHTAFTSTSGVLVRAAASSTPVVASEHGLVGWRTREHSLGMTFVYPDAKGLCRAIVEVLDSSFDPSGGLEFANACSERMLALSLEGLLHD